MPSDAATGVFASVHVTRRPSMAVVVTFGNVALPTGAPKGCSDVIKAWWDFHELSTFFASPPAPPLLPLLDESFIF